MYVKVGYRKPVNAMNAECRLRTEHIGSAAGTRMRKEKVGEVADEAFDVLHGEEY